ncbi:MAG: hypothetical protein AAF356_06860 [Planctomycetota bacterium]
MRFSDVLAALDIGLYPIIGLVMFVLAFAIVAWRVMRSTRDEMTYNAEIPLTDGGELSQSTQGEEGIDR